MLIADKYIIMRNLINLITPLFEDTQEVVSINPEELEGIKNTLSLKIKELPDTPETAKLLAEIEDILQSINAGGKLGLINSKLTDLNDPTVLAAQKEIARFIASIDMTPPQRDELFSMWKSDKLVNVDKLLSTGKHTFSDLFNGYNTNPATKELIDELMEVSALGQGKGEFGLNVLSKRIAKPVGKGDLLIDNRKIEVKTVHLAAARFTDGDVRPAAGYEAAAQAVNSFVKVRNPDPKFLPKSGLNLDKAVQFGQGLEGQEKAEYNGLIEQLITVIFGGPNADSSDISAVTRAMKLGNFKEAIQAYARASFNYYMSIKDDEGVLYLNLGESPKFSIFYKTAEDLSEIGQRFEAETVYITSPTFREIYPKISIISTSRGSMSIADTPPSAEQAVSAERQSAIDTKIQDVAQRKPISKLRPERSTKNPRQER
jgi:hypothetical protein